ncbi:MAG: PD-(D/E)XK nuclease domain-containing protein [Lachnospiraceae bacterium]|nr:PD-(D/E)XK nuclease domain-containing protein [Lachnospiraceae bacterium]
MIWPKAKEGNAYIMEFKVKKKKETNLENTVREALKQIEEKGYEAELVALGIPKENIRKYGFAFEGKQVLIGS